ncbi:MAG: hypothetical protein ACQETH_00505 [Candidatus Rifleibacteriota bacterium]
MSIKRILFICLILAAFTNVPAYLAAKNIVVPTNYGYGLVNSSTVVRPCISSYYPYAAPAYAVDGYYANYYNLATLPTPATWAHPVVPVWNGLYWYYQHNNLVAVSSCNLNVRSQPYVVGKKNKKNSNVIATLKTGEQVYILGQQGNWYMVQALLAPLRRGYVYGSYLRFYRSYASASAGYNNLKYPSSYVRSGW